MLTKINALVFCVLAGSASADVKGRIDVVDGDTFKVGKETVRLFGIDAPEQDQSCQSPEGANWACGAWVSGQVRERYQGKWAVCAPLGSDRYQRVIARCEVKGQDVGETLVSDGLAFAYRRYSMIYDLTEKQAAVNGRGLHGNQVENPAAFRSNRTKGKTPPKADCAIKGNISASGFIYHVPGQRDYANTGINVSKGERWFCSETEARAAGWRKARR